MTSHYTMTPGGSDLDATAGFRNITVLDQPEVPCVVVRASNVPMAELPSLFDPAFSRLPAVIAEAGLQITAPALAIYTRIGGVDAGTTTCDIAAGFPVSGPLEQPVPLGGTEWNGTELTAENATLPAGRIGALSHMGGYDGLSDTWQSLMQGMTERGLEPQPPFWEVYVTEPRPDADPSLMRTDLFIQLATVHAD